MSTKAELPCVYASLILVDDHVAITREKIAIILRVANIGVELYWPGLFAKALEGVNVKDLITGVGAGGNATPAAAAKKKEEEPEESDNYMCFAIFD